MRILMLAQFYPPTIGGEERHVRNLSAALAARGHDVSVATLWQEGLPDHELDGQVRVHRIRGTMQRMDPLFAEPNRRHAPPFADPEVLAGLRRVVAREKPDIVHAHNWLLHSYVPVKLWSKAPLVVTLHDYGLICPKKSLMYRGTPCSGPGLAKCFSCLIDHYGVVKGVVVEVGHRLARIAECAAVDMFLPVSHAVAEGNALDGGKLPYQVMPNFVPDDVGVLPADAGARPSQLPAEPYLLFVGNVTRIKGIHVLLRAYAGLVNAPPLVLIGLACHDTPAEFPPNVIALRNCPHEMVVRAWHESLFGIVPSIWPDPCPTVAMEAMATGRPIVAARMGGLPDLVDDGKTGFLVPPGDHVALRNAMQRLLDDPGLRREMGEAALKKVTFFQARSTVPRIEQVYRSLLDNKPAGVMSGRACTAIEA